MQSRLVFRRNRVIFDHGAKRYHRPVGERMNTGTRSFSFFPSVHFSLLPLSFSPHFSTGFQSHKLSRRPEPSGSAFRGGLTRSPRRAACICGEGVVVAQPPSEKEVLSLETDVKVPQKKTYNYVYLFLYHCNSNYHYLHKYHYLKKKEESSTTDKTDWSGKATPSKNKQRP